MLTNAIHPLLRQASFDPTLEYEAFEPSLRLVSRLLETAQVRHFLHAMWFGTNEHIGDTVNGTLRGMKAEAYRSNRSVLGLSKDDVVAVDAKLATLAKMVRFHVHDLPEWINGQCRACKMPVVPGISRPGGPPCPTLADFKGANSDISITRTRYDALVAASRSGQTEHDLKHEQFDMAMLIFHELGHAAHNAQMGHRPADFFGDALIAESGFDITACVFGAIPQRSTKNKQSLWMNWPNRLTLDTYEKHGPPKLAYRDLDTIKECKKACYAPAFEVELWEDSFWDDTVRLKGPKALVIPAFAIWTQEAIWNGDRVPVPASVTGLFAMPVKSLRPKTRLRQRVTFAVRERYNSLGVETFEEACDKVGASRSSGP